jgi:carbonic anhydrase
MMRVHRLFFVLVLFAATLSAQTWAELEAGNKRFAKNPQLVYRGLPGIRTDLWRSGQNPKVTILACADSRVTPELLFDQTLGRLFVVRVAGNVADPFDIASIEYAISKDWTRTIVVIGHEKCGAVEAAMEKGHPGSPALDALVERIRESFVVSKPQNLTEAIKGNAKFTVDYLLAHSDIIKAATLRPQNPVRIFAAYYDMQTGLVTPLP